jgi:hypothetical protein
VQAAEFMQRDGRLLYVSGKNRKDKNVATVGIFPPTYLLTETCLDASSKAWTGCSRK